MDLFNNIIYQQDLKYAATFLPVKNGRILVTGASGLVGSFLVDTLLYANLFLGHSHDIYALGRNEKRLKSRFCVCENEINIIAQDVMIPLEDEIEYDYVIHAASNADPISYAQYPAGTMKTTLLGTMNILEYLRKHPSCRLLFTSTSDVYGETEQLFRTEGDVGYVDFNQIRSCYPESKRSAELLCRCYHLEHQVDAVIARLCYTYGPTLSDNDSKVAAQFIRKCLAGEEILLKSKGEQKRSYCYVADVAAGLLQILFYGRSGEAYNVSSSSSNISICEMAEIAAKKANTKVVYGNLTEAEKAGVLKTMDNILDASKLEQLGWKPQYTFTEGFYRTIDILKQCREI